MAGKIYSALRQVRKLVGRATLFLVWVGAGMFALAWFVVVWVPIALILALSLLILLCVGMALSSWDTSIRRRRAYEYWRARTAEERLRERQELAAKAKYQEDEPRASRVRLV